MTLFLLLICLLPSGLWAQQLKYVLERSGDTRFPDKCFEVDATTNGKKYKAEVELNKCQGREQVPSKTMYIFIQYDSPALLSGAGVKGQCYEVDSATRGKKFKSSVDQTKCKPAKTQVKWIKGSLEGCYRVGEGNWKERVDEKNCATKETKFLFIIQKSIYTDLQGDCFIVDKETSGDKYKVKAKPESCRPKNVSYKWMPRKDFPGCFEIGQNGWFNKVGNKLCKPKDTTFKFIKEKRELFIGRGFLGECFEVDVKTLGNKYKNKVEQEKCRPKNVIYKWIENSITSGCYELGSNDWTKLVDNILCKPKKTKYVFERELRLGSIRRGFLGTCYEVDVETSGRKYKIRSDIEKCHPAHLCYKMTDRIDQGNMVCYSFDCDDKIFLDEHDGDSGEKGAISFMSKISNWLSSDESGSVSKFQKNGWLGQAEQEKCRQAFINGSQSVRKKNNAIDNSSGNSNSGIQQ